METKCSIERLQAWRATFPRQAQDNRTPVRTVEPIHLSKTGGVSWPESVQAIITCPSFSSSAPTINRSGSCQDGRGCSCKSPVVITMGYCSSPMNASILGYLLDQRLDQVVHQRHARPSRGLHR